MPTVALGDIHGNLLALNDLLAQIVPVLRPEDTLVFLGDYIDRGPDSRGCAERIVRLGVEADFSVVTLLHFWPERLFICFRRASIPRLGISIHLPDRVTQSNQIATRRFCSAARGVLRKFCLIQP